MKWPCRPVEDGRTASDWLLEKKAQEALLLLTFHTGARRAVRKASTAARRIEAEMTKASS
jgi:hypothetical protein